MTINTAVCNSALTYAGKVPYLYGGHSIHGWDCSGFVNHVLGINFGMLLPAMTVHYSTVTYHGPPAEDYYNWGGYHAVTIPVDALAPGDLVVWSTHVGIALDPYYMVSALNTAYGTAVTPIQGFGPQGEPMRARHFTLPG